MEPCSDLQCLLQRLRLRNRITSTVITESSGTLMVAGSTTDLPGSGGFFPVSSQFRILLPILLVLGVFILIAIGLVLHRLVLKVVRKRWASTRANAVQISSLRGTGESGSGANGVSTVSEYVDSPPSYGQVLATIENGESPPAYYQVVSGVVNLGFNQENEQSDEGGAQSSSDNRQQSLGTQQTEQPNSTNPASEPRATRATGTNTFRTPYSATGALASVETPRRHIDDIIDSIAVPSAGGMDSLDRPAAPGRVFSGKRKPGSRRPPLRASISLPRHSAQTTRFARENATRTPADGVAASELVIGVPKTTAAAIARPGPDSSVQATPV